MTDRTNAWGEPLAEALDDDPWAVPEPEQLDHDHPTDPESNALTAETGDDLDGWETGDPV